jgi:hypothetical protein
MSSLLNSLFFIKKEHLNLNNVLNVLRDFMFTKLNQTAILLRSNLPSRKAITNVVTVENMLSTDIINEPLRKIEVTFTNELKSDPIVDNKPVELVVSPSQRDTLFWCLFIVNFGFGEYTEVDRNYGVKELEVKKQIGEYITANPHKMKSTNVKITKAGIQEILSELLTSQKDTSMNCLMALLVFYNINLIMVNSTELLMLEFKADKDAELPTYVVYKDTYNKYSTKIEPLTKEEIIEMKNKMICLESYLKPLKAISNYKLEELEDLAKKMGIFENNKKYKKTDLYQEISEACVWL